jgi:hypothetical protein
LDLSGPQPGGTHEQGEVVAVHLPLPSGQECLAQQLQHVVSVRRVDRGEGEQVTNRIVSPARSVVNELQPQVLE